MVKAVFRVIVALNAFVLRDVKLYSVFIVFRGELTPMFCILYVTNGVLKVKFIEEHYYLD